MHPDSQAFFKAFGIRLREIRKSKGWSVRDMVAQHGYHDAQWRHYENGSPVTIDSLLRMATIFNVTLVELLDGLGRFPKEVAPEKIPGRRGKTVDRSSETATL
jgi:transcriptional regulator with XRE-family HTH domain